MIASFFVLLIRGTFLLSKNYKNEKTYFIWSIYTDCNRILILIYVTLLAKNSRIFYENNNLLLIYLI